MSQLEELKRQRKELDAKIKELENIEIICGVAKFDGRHVSIIIKKWDEERKYDNLWKKIIYSNRSEPVKEQLKTLIYDLQTLYDKI